MAVRHQMCAFSLSNSKGKSCPMQTAKPCVRQPQVPQQRAPQPQQKPVPTPSNEVDRLMAMFHKL